MILELIQNPVKSFNEEKTGYLLLSWENHFPEKVICLKRMVEALIGQLPSFEKDDFSFIVSQFEDFLNNPKKQSDQETIFFQWLLLLLKTIEDSELKAHCFQVLFFKLHDISINKTPIRINFDPKNISFETYCEIVDAIPNSNAKIKQVACFIKVLKSFPYFKEQEKFVDYFLSTVREMVIPKNSSINELKKVLDINEYPSSIFLYLDSGSGYEDKSLVTLLSNLKKESKESVISRIDDVINQFLINPVYDDSSCFIIRKIKEGEFGEDPKTKLIGILKKKLDEKIDDSVFYEEIHDSKNIMSKFFGGISTPKLYQKQIECAPLLKLWDFLSKFINISRTSIDFPVVQNLIPLIFKRQQKIINDASKEELIDYLFEMKSKSQKITKTDEYYSSNHQRHSHNLSGVIDPFLIQYNSMLMMKISERLSII